MLVKELIEYLHNFDTYDKPEIEFNGVMFEFIVSCDGFVVLGPGEETGQIWDILDTLDADLKLNTAVAMEVVLEKV
jgi:hypothetical protein